MSSGGDGGFSPFLPAQDRGVQRRLSFPADWIKAPSGCLRPRAGVGKREAEGEQANLIITSTGARKKKGEAERGEERRGELSEKINRHEIIFFSFCQ